MQRIPVIVTCDVLVVGGGVTGSATARALAAGGADVVLVERFDLNTQGSGYNAGSLHAQLQHDPFVHRGEAWARAYEPATRFLVDSIAVWQGLSDELGVDLEVACGGGLLIAETEAQLRDIERKVALEREQGLEVELLSAADLQRVAPYVSSQMAGGELCAIEGKANPLLAGPALARDAERRGARVLRHTELTALVRDGSAFRASTSAGEIRASRVVSCGGVDAGRVTGMLGVDLPVSGEAIQASVTEPVAKLVPHLVYFAGEKLTLKQARVGSLLIGGGWPARVVAGRPTVAWDSLRENLRIAQSVVPAVGRARLLRTWAGYVNATPDWLPFIGEVERGLFVGAFPYMGFTAAPLLGQVLGDLVLGRDPGRDLSPFSALARRGPRQERTDRPASRCPRP
jgi:glycine/D-amino acid oxidase-like deaminating enzyme